MTAVWELRGRRSDLERLCRREECPIRRRRSSLSRAAIPVVSSGSSPIVVVVNPQRITIFSHILVIC